MVDVTDEELGQGGVALYQGGEQVEDDARSRLLCVHATRTPNVNGGTSEG